MYRFYFNPDDETYVQVYGKGEITPEYAYQKINSLVGKDADNYFPVCLAVELFGREMVLPCSLNDKMIEETWHFPDMTKRKSTVYYELDEMFHTVPWNRNTTDKVI